MNRRKFFGMTIGAVIAAGLPELVLPERKIFLPPSAGWTTDANVLGYELLLKSKTLKMEMEAILYNVDPLTTPLLRQIKWSSWEVRDGIMVRDLET